MSCIHAIRRLFRRQRRQQGARPLPLAGGDHAFRHAGKRLEIIRVGLQHRAER